MCTLGRSLSGIGSAWALVRWVMCCGRRSSSSGNVLTSIQAVLCLWSRSYNVSGLTVVVVVLFLILLLLWCLGSGWKKLSSESDCAVRGLRKHAISMSQAPFLRINVDVTGSPIGSMYRFALI